MNEMIDEREYQVELANKMKRLLANEDFTLIFDEVFIRAFSITNMYNLINYDEETRQRYMEKAVARSVFNQFIQDILEDGKIAKDSMDEDATAENDQA